MKNHRDRLPLLSVGSDICAADGTSSPHSGLLEWPEQQDGTAHSATDKSQWLVYTPSGEEKKTRRLLKQLDIHCAVNDYSVSEWSGKCVFFHGMARLNELQKHLLQTAGRRGAKVSALGTLAEERLKQVPVEFLDAETLLGMDVMLADYGSFCAKMRRAFDVAAAGVLLLLCLPILLLTALAIKLDSPGPVLFRQERVGLFNRAFTVLKFRSMYMDAEKHGARWASVEDSRITRVGHWIRRFRIDELPQLFNVFKGDMSLIGPRPEREVFIAGLEKQIPYYRFRHLVKPGITGLAQVMYHYGASVEDARNKHRYDLYYIKHRSFWLDLQILCHTVLTVLGAHGR